MQSRPDWDALGEMTSIEELDGNFLNQVFTIIYQANLPNPDRPPLYFDPPARREDGALIMDAALTEKLQQGFFLERHVGEYAENLKSLRGFKFDWGRHDGNQDHVYSNQFYSRKLNEFGVPHEAEEYNGGWEDGMFNKRGRLETDVLPFFQRHLDFEEMTSHKFHSAALGHDYAYVAYVPDGYDQTDANYPVVYLLHGSLGDEHVWTEFVETERILDDLIESGAIPPTLVIMPGSLSWWADGFNEPAATAFMEDLIPHIDTNWRTLAESQSRVIGGLSAGGFGTVNLVMKHPEQFAAALAFSPASYAGLPPEGSSAWTHPTFQDAEGNFDPDLWHRLNYESLIDAYTKQDVVVPFYINSGDHDALDIAYHDTNGRSGLKPFPKRSSLLSNMSSLRSRPILIPIHLHASLAHGRSRTICFAKFGMAAPSKN